jgi:5'-methylthioadenosine phosphorylase
MPEAKLAREAELPYALLALSTDYDCWHETAADVSVAAVLEVMGENVAKARRTVQELVPVLPDPSTSQAASALAGALMTSRDRIAPEALCRLDWLVGKYIP